MTTETAVEKFETDEGRVLRAAFDQAWADARAGVGPPPASAYPPVTAEEARARMTAWMLEETDGIETYVSRQAWFEALAEVVSLRAAAARVRAVHPEEFMGVDETWPVCGFCRDSDEEPTPYPCPTVRALDGEA